jgi:nucleotide-binding universal stress UspA family protein
MLRRLLDPDRVSVTILHVDAYGNEVVADRYAASVLDEAMEAMRGVGITATTMRLRGDVVGGIDEARAREGSELTVVGAGNHTWLGGVVFGSVSTHLVHHATAPVLVVHRAPNVSHERLRVLVGVDGSPSVASASSLLTRITHPARIDVHLCSAVVPALVMVAPHLGGASFPGDMLEEMTAERVEAADRYLADMQHRLVTAGYEATATKPEGAAPLVLLDEVSRLESDLVVLGARGLGPLGRITVGSVSEHVARHAPASLVAHATDQGA